MGYYKAGKNSGKRLASACRRGKVLDWEKVCGYRCWEASPFITTIFPKLRLQFLGSPNIQFLKIPALMKKPHIRQIRRKCFESLEIMDENHKKDAGDMDKAFMGKRCDIRHAIFEEKDVKGAYYCTYSCVISA